MLGSGQFGGVQIGIWNGSKGRREVAIKTLNPTITQPDAKVKFLQEAAIMAQFRHPNVIQLGQLQRLSTSRTASDVWSYGCLLYEIWSMDMKPLEGKINADVVQIVDSGYRPPGCLHLVYQLMIQCWNPDNPDTYSRPISTCSFISLQRILGAPLEAGEKMYIDLQKSYV
eukprot:Em0008g880a